MAMSVCPSHNLIQIKQVFKRLSQNFVWTVPTPGSSVFHWFFLMPQWKLWLWKVVKHLNTFWINYQNVPFSIEPQVGQSFHLVTSISQFGTKFGTISFWVRAKCLDCYGLLKKIKSFNVERISSKNFHPTSYNILVYGQIYKRSDPPEVFVN